MMVMEYRTILKTADSGDFGFLVGSLSLLLVGNPERFSLSFSESKYTSKKLGKEIGKEIA